MTDTTLIQNSVELKFEDLTPEQQNVVNGIGKFLNDPDANFLRVVGPAGTGKTSVINLALMPSHKEGKRIIVTAFTNKATKTIGDKTPYAEAISLFRLLGMVPNTDETKIKFNKILSGPLADCSIIIADEASMINSGHFALLLKMCNEIGIKLIVMGDKCQLSPVGQSVQSLSLRFETDYHYELTQIVRQGKESDIPKYAQIIRNIQDRIDSGEKISIKTPIEFTYKGDDLVILNNYKEFIDQIIQDYKSEEYKLDNNYVKVMAYKNKMVDFLNLYIREQIYGKNSDGIYVGESVILNAGSQDGILHTSDECTILDILDTGFYQNDHEGVSFDFQWFDVHLKRTSDNITYRIKIVNPLHRNSLNASLKMWGDQINIMKDPREKKLHNNEYYHPFIRDWNSPSFCYAITSHKSQGSTYAKCYVDASDIRSTGGSAKTLWQSMYVAVTRASKSLVIFEKV